MEGGLRQLVLQKSFYIFARCQNPQFVSFRNHLMNKIRFFHCCLPFIIELNVFIFLILLFLKTLQFFWCITILGIVAFPNQKVRILVEILVPDFVPNHSSILIHSMTINASKNSWFIFATSSRPNVDIWCFLVNSGINCRAHAKETALRTTVLGRFYLSASLIILPFSPNA